MGFFKCPPSPSSPWSSFFFLSLDFEMIYYLIISVSKLMKKKKKKDSRTYEKEFLIQLHFFLLSLSLNNWFSYERIIYTVYYKIKATLKILQKWKFPSLRLALNLYSVYCTCSSQKPATTTTEKKKRKTSSLKFCVPV